MKNIAFKHENISAVGLGTTGFWSGRNPGLKEVIRTAYNSYGINLFDTAEMYGNGRCESALADALQGIERSRLFLVDKIHPDNAAAGRFERSLDQCLTRLNTDYIDLYLLHWREKTELPFLVEAMHKARKEGKIRYWGVSNFDINDMQDLFSAGGTDCFCNQIFFCLYERGPEYDLLPFMKEHDILPMSYSSLGSGYYSHPDIRKNKEIMKVCAEYQISPEAVMLRMNMEYGFAALFSTSSLSHLHANLQEIPDDVYRAVKPVFDSAFPPPDHAVPLVKI